MKQTKTTKILTTLLLSLTIFSAISQTGPMANGLTGTWDPVANFTDEFGTAKNGVGSKWQANPAQASVWKWDTANNVRTAGGSAFITAKHFKNGFSARIDNNCTSKKVNATLYFRSGILKSKGTINISQENTGIFVEARIKGVQRFPGFSPALWLFSNPDNKKATNKVLYNEIDIVELTQGNKKNVTFHDLHSKRMVNGKPKFFRPSDTPSLKTKKSVGNAAAFNVYGAYITKQTITWYINGKKVASKANTYWKQRPYNLALSLGLRAPFVKQNTCTNNGPSKRTKVPVKPASTATIANQVMEVEWVRTWRKRGGSSKQVNDKITANDVVAVNNEDIAVNNSELKLYPNPATDVLNFDLGTDESTEVFIYDVTGKEVYKETFPNGKVSLEGLHLNGLHFIKAISATISLEDKIIFTQK